MRGMRGIGAVALAAAFALLLGGCAPQSEPVRPKPSPSASPIFASDDEALAAATKAYAAYLAMSDQIAQEGGMNPERLSPLVSADWLPNEVAAFAKFSDSGHRQLGFSKFDHVQLQQLGKSDGGNEWVRIYLCLDFSDAQLVDSQGHNVRPRDLDLRSPFQASFQSSQAEPLRLVLTESELWPGADFC